MKASSLLSVRSAACLHLFLVGIPLKFGVLPLNLALFRQQGRRACQRMFGGATQDCTPLEAFVMKDFGVRFLQHYTLAIAAIVILWTTKTISSTRTQAQLLQDQQHAFRTLHLRLVGMSFLHIFCLAWMQHWTPLMLDPDFFATVVIYSLMAIALSSVYITTRESSSQTSSIVDMSSVSWSLPGVAWSFPGIAIFIGAVRIVSLEPFYWIDSSSIAHSLIFSKLQC
jgi:hypothetical protein